MHDQLRDLYRKHWRALVPLVKPHGTLSGPLLIDVPSGYTEQPVKLFVVGQETNGWGEKAPIDAPDAIEQAMAGYLAWDLGVSYKRGYFFRAVRTLEKHLDIAPGKILWSNLNKCDENNDPLSQELTLRLMEAFPVLPGEIAITKPDVVFFFSGPNYDGHIRSHFSGCKIEPVEGTGMKEGELARVVHDGLPKASFRTYHPEYLKYGKLDRFLLTLVAVVKRMREEPKQEAHPS